MGAKRPKTAEDIELARIASRERSIKFISGCGLTAFIVWQIVRAYVELKDEPPKPPWLVAFLAIFGPGGLVTLFMGCVIWYVRRFTKRLAPRNAELERRIDPTRQSSGLRENGTDPTPGEDS